jgi:hypothetical protein
MASKPSSIMLAVHNLVQLGGAGGDPVLVSATAVRTTISRVGSHGDISGFNLSVRRPHGIGLTLPAVSIFSPPA